MVDQQSRAELALSLRRLAAGRITNDEFDHEAGAMFSHRTDDPALAELSTYGWLHYGDLSTYRLRGRHALSREERRSIARAVLFLKTDQEYVHGASVMSCTCLGGPFLRGVIMTAVIAGFVGVLFQHALNSFWLGVGMVLVSAYFGVLLNSTVIARIRRRRWERSRSADDTFWPFMDDRASSDQFRFWPFANKQAYEVALSDPPFLCGRGTI